jgi:hypothetical protein
MSTRENNAKIVSTCGQRLAALNKHMKAKTAMTVSGKQMKLADLVSVYQAAVDTRAALVPQRAAFDEAIAARDSAEASRRATDKALKAWVINEFGPDSPQAHEFGFLPTKVTPKSAETKATAVGKLRATRTARGTMGKRQKEKIKGTIVAPAAPADPAVTAPAAAPAASVPTATNGAPNGASPSNGVAGQH